MNSSEARESLRAFEFRIREVLEHLLADALSLKRAQFEGRAIWQVVLSHGGVVLALMKLQLVVSHREEVLLDLASHVVDAPLMVRGVGVGQGLGSAQVLNLEFLLSVSRHHLLLEGVTRADGGLLLLEKGLEIVCQRTASDVVLHDALQQGVAVVDWRSDGVTVAAVENEGGASTARERGEDGVLGQEEGGKLIFFEHIFC
mmetsp:Transcript_41834/g.63975  ORF Transcript_41834/g.63975 Transcript_41834/m.63975 type:complete len:201 (+) Transcript_41834:301-903(+)